MKNILDLVIIGAGPGGLSAAIYAKRAMLNFVVVDKFLPGGQIANTFELENYLGVGRVTGLEMTDMMMKHIELLDISVCNEEVISTVLNGDIKEVKTNKTTYLTKKVIVATGASPKKLGCPGEERLFGRGISNCATCDGFLYRDKTVMVVGGGDVAVEDALYLSRIAKKVYLVHRRNELRAVKSLQDRLFKLDNVEFLWHHEVIDVHGEDCLDFVELIHNQSKEIVSVEVDGVFIAVGYHPNTEFISHQDIFSEGNWIKTDINCQTSMDGVYAIGDIRDTSLRQVVTAVSDGAVAVSHLSKYL